VPDPQPKPQGYNTLAKSMVTGAVKKLSFATGMSMPSMPKLGWYKSKKEETKEAKEEVKDAQVTQQTDTQEDVPDFRTRHDSDDETKEVKQEI
jgi:hypothetical protein